MARRTIEKPVEPREAIPPPARRPGFLALVVAALTLAISGGTLIYLLTREAPRPRTIPAPPAGITSPSPSPSPSPAPAMTWEAFLALPDEEKRAIVERAMSHFFEVYAGAARRLTPEPLTEVATGPELEILRRNIEEWRAEGRPVELAFEHRVVRVAASPRFEFVSVHVEGTRRSWWLDPQTLQRASEVNEQSESLSYTLALEEGKWKVRDVIEDSS